ncbi:MAG: hypothetical protein M3350_10660 [Actinomycetota bacterium]|nr:hypothetical protein [Actinomycetota bacterium]MDQ3721221.1 hypothetical protein [Actinomycetota bacterium]
MARPRPVIVLLCLLALSLSASACGKPEEPFREGLAEELDGLEYNLFITRQLNPSITPDQAFYKGPDPGKGQTLYGLFITVCNREKEAARSIPAEKFVVKDSTGAEFVPKPLPRDNDFAYNQRTLQPEECIPAAGSVAQQQSAAGALLVYELPVESVENRPLELEIEGSYNLMRGEHDKLAFELDF